MALAWKAGWVNALRGSNPLSSAIRGRTLACETPVVAGAGIVGAPGPLVEAHLGSKSTRPTRLKTNRTCRVGGQDEPDTAG
jgi:hypothetical protein